MPRQRAGSGQALEPRPAQQDPPAQVRALLNLLADPTTQKWLEKQGLPKPAAPPAHCRVEGFGLGLFLLPGRCDPRAHRRARRRAPRSAEPVRARRRARPRGTRPSAGGSRSCCSWLFSWLSGLASSGCFAGRRRGSAAASTGSRWRPSSDRLRVVAVAVRLCRRLGRGFCARQHRPFPRARLAAAAARDAVRLSPRLSGDPRRDHRRPFLVGPRSRTLPDRPDGSGGGSVLVPAAVAFVGWFAFGWVEIGFLRHTRHLAGRAASSSPTCSALV